MQNKEVVIMATYDISPKMEFDRSADLSFEAGAKTVAELGYKYVEAGPPASLETLDANLFANEQRQLFDVVRKETEPEVTLGNNSNMISCIEVLLQSARDGRFVQVEIC